MGLLVAPFRIEDGEAEAGWYPAHVAVRERTAPGLCFELSADRGWVWSGRGGPVPARLIDVLAAAGLARLAGWGDARPAVLAAHAAAASAALDTALAGGPPAAARRLAAEQAAALDTIDEWQLCALADPPLSYRTVKNYKLGQPSRLPPPVLVAGHQQTVWLWAREQAEGWVASRPGSAWRRGLSDDEITASGRRLPGRPRRVPGP
jgi:hypothetical protein